MKTITFTIKQASLSMACMFMGLLCFTSCDNQGDDVSSADSITAADIFLSSAQYQEYEAFTKQDSKKMKNALKALSRSERQRYAELMKMITPDISEDAYQAVVDEIYELTKIDIDSRVKKQFVARAKCFQGTNFKKGELLKALQKKFANAKTVMTRSSNSEEACMRECQYAYDAFLSECYDNIDDDDYSGTPFDETMNFEYIDPSLVKRIMEYENWAETRSCLMEAEGFYDLCMADCYGV